ncbi:hypothetical protein AB4Z52_13670 [Rhizobium sp. 2YAF20]|uniref:hypothetical protein n=1 Tax=Rhizobium sp. 2YAF20 TaxID=3233027 RepID=UPI003F9DDA43
MTPDNVARIRTMYRHYYHPSVDNLPDGWWQLVMDFLHLMDGIGDLTDSVSIRFERGPDGVRAFVFPEMSRWSPDQMNTLRIAQHELYGLSQQTCELCGLPGAAEDGHVYCIGHAGGDEKTAREAALYHEVRDLFPEVHGKAINLAVPEYMSNLLAITFRAILKIVVDEDIVGKVLITKVEMDGGALFVRVRYLDLEAVFMGVQMSINEMISDLETLSDELTRKHGGSNAS